MKLYKFKQFFKRSKDDIHKICEKYGIKNYTVNPDGTIDVDDSVDFFRKELKILPLKFNRVNGNFDCGNNQLVTLEGSPKYVGGYFSCQINSIENLIGAPEYVGDNFYCSFNMITSLIGGPKTVVGVYNCRNNNITDFEGFPEFYEGEVYFDNNPVNEILRLITLDKELKFIHLINEYDVIRNGKTIIRNRLEEAYYVIGMELPDDINIYGYEII